MTLAELRYIVALAAERHFGRAAERCHVAQPTLSVAVKKLETELGAVLFERGKEGIWPTPLGRRVLAIAEQMLLHSAVIKDTVESDPDQLEGPLALGAVPTIGPYLLPQVIPLLQEMARGMSLYVEEADSRTLAAKLRSGELDAVLVSAPFTEPDVVTQTLFDDPFVLLLPSGHRLAKRATVSAGDIDPEEMLMLSEGHELRRAVLDVFKHLERNDDRQGRFIVGSTIETLRHMVASGLGITIIPQAAAFAPIYAPGMLLSRPFEAPAPKRTIQLAWRVTFPRHKAIEVLRRCIQASSAVHWRYATAPVYVEPGVLIDNHDW
ncbi:MAG TPA: LysR substrate-binding domain-containing protein [Steroidobacteraceae bacterium]|nr:LysR substrate-binding domain-containing protein [Steroidobacteraceae bacterium]